MAWARVTPHVQAARLRRELEHVRGERDAARDEAARAEAGRQHAEQELKVAVVVTVPVYVWAWVVLA
jgi:outer membrane murein-binding lipoprotein Lpp